MNLRKRTPLLSLITSLIILTFLWSQCIWASGVELYSQTDSVQSQKNFPCTVQESSSKNFSKIRTAINLDPLISALDLLKNSLQNSLLSGWNNGLDQVTGYVDTVTKPNGEKEVIEMSGITYWADGRMKGYTQTTTGPNDKGKQETHTISIYNTEYDSLGRISRKYGVYDNKPYSWSAISYDELGRPTAYKERLGKARIKHYDIRYNELGDVAYEKVKTTVKSAFSKSESLNEYWYGYDDHGQLEKIKENEIYSKSSRTFLGKLVDAILYGPLAFLPDKIFLEYIKPAIQAVVGFLNPALVPLMIALDTVRNIMFGMDIGDALKGAAIQLLTWAITAGLSGGAPPIETLVGQELAKAIITKAVQTIATRLVYDLLEDKLGTFGAALVSALVGNLITTISPIPGYDTGFLTSEGVFDWLGILQTTAQAGIKALIAEIAKRNPDLAWALPLIETLLNMAISQAIQEARESIKEQKIKELQAKGYNVILDQNKNVIGLTRIDEENGIIYYYTPDEKLQYSDQIVQKDGQEYIIRTYGLAYSEVYIRDTTTGSLNLLFKGEGWFNSIDTYTNKEGSTLQFISLTAPDGTTAYFELDGTPVLSTLPDGRILSYDINGNPEGWLAPGAMPRWNQGQFAGSYMEDTLGTTYFDRNGNHAGFTPKGYTAVQVDDQIAYSYQKISDDSFYMVDKDGQNNRYIRQQLDGMNIPIGEFIADNTTTAYYDSRGIKLWDRENQPNSIINLYLEDGSPWAQITTKVSQSGLIEGYRFTDLATGDFRQYNENGELQAYYLARKDREGNIYGYKGVDTQGTQITLDRDGNIHSTLTKKGEYSVYKNGELYRVLRRESVAILDQGVLDRDSITGKFTLYTDQGTKITDNPVMIVVKLNFSLFTIPEKIVKDLWADAMGLLQAVKDNMISPYEVEQIEGLREKITNGFEYLKEISEIIPFSTALAYGAERAPKLQDLVFSIFRAYNSSGSRDVAWRGGGEFINVLFFQYNDFLENNPTIKRTFLDLTKAVRVEEIKESAKFLKDMAVDIATAPLKFINPGTTTGKIAKELIKIGLKLYIKEGDVDDVAKSYIIDKLQDVVIEKALGKLKIEELDPISEIIVDKGVTDVREKLVDFFKDHENWFSDIKVYELPQKYSERKLIAWPPFSKVENDRGFGEMFIYNTKTQDIVAILYKIYPNNEMISIVAENKWVEGPYGPYVPESGWTTTDIIYTPDFTKMENIAGAEG